MNWKNLWKELTPHPLSSIVQATEQYHLAVQYIAMAGKNLLPQQADDSQTTLEWWPDRRCFAGRRIPGNPDFRLVLDTREFSLVFYRDVRHPGEFLSLSGLKDEEVFSWVNEISLRKGATLDDLKRVDHYSLPPNFLSKGETFSTPTNSAQDILATYRSNADLALAHVAAKIPASGPVRVWPHHFDTGSSVALGPDNGTTEFMGFGMAIPDTYVSDYYFYVNFSSNKQEMDVGNLPEVEGIGEWHAQDWLGRILPLGQIVELSSPLHQAEAVESFFYRAVQAISSLSKISAANLI